MTKKQQTFTRGFGKRTLSVILAMLIVLSTFVVMLTATSITANAAISYWRVCGNFNGWADSTDRINSGSGGSITIPITESSIEFKMVANEDGDKWCGNSSGSMTNGSETELQWNAGSNIRVALPANTVSVTFTLSVRNGKNYVRVTANTQAPDPDPPVVGSTSFTAPVNKYNSDNTNKDKIFWAEATYYDYLSDREITNGWLYPDHVGTMNSGFNQNNGNKDEWYPFYIFNRDVVKKVADNNYGWSAPLYFGNFCNTYGAYDTSHHPGVSNGYNDATGSGNVTRFNYAANNSNGVYDMYTSVQGLMGSTLQNGKLQTPNGTLAPYFDEATLGSNARVVKSAFPFRKMDMGGYMRYEFDSTNAKDNVYFTWETSGGRSYPTAVNYGAGTAYGVKDGLKDFMGTTPGYGIFPFNNASSNYKGTKTYTNEKLDYGFGIRMDMKFRVPKDTEVKFDFSGDDDLWMYITDEKGNSQLVLDMGGSHKMSEGEVNFNTQKATVKKVEKPGTANKDIWVVEESNWGNITLYAFNNGSDGEWYTADNQYSNQYRFCENSTGSKGGTLGSKSKFIITRGKDNWDGQSPDLYMSERAGKCTYTPKPGTGNNFRYDSNNVQVGGPSGPVTTSFNFDPNKTYTMTIFYMERGLLESNCKMGFTLTPLGNNFIVTEQIDTTDVNEGIRDFVKEHSSFDISYTGTKKDGSPLVNDEPFALGDGDELNISDELIGINSNVSVTQSVRPDSETDYLEYDTTWDYWDNVNKKQFDIGGSGAGTTGGGDSTSTGQQTMIDPSTGDEYDYAELQVNYRNKPRVTSVSITKEVKSNKPEDFGKTFPATIKLKFGSGGTFKAYDLQTSDGWAPGGNVTLWHGHTITISGVPVGTRVKVEENPGPDFSVSYSPEQMIAGTTNSMTVSNIRPDATGEITTRKLIKMPSGSFPYEGDLFTFKVEGIDPVEYETGKWSESTAYMGSKELSDTDENGEILFKNSGAKDDKFLKFTEAGTYFVKVYETSIKKIGTYDKDITKDNTVYLARFDVESDDGKLNVSDAVYYKYDDGFIVPTTGGGKAVFGNPTQPCSVTVNKTDGAGKDLDDVYFNIYKVDGNGGEIKTENAVGKAKKTVNGTCTFSDLDIYQTPESGKFGARPDYQWYALEETQTKDGYVKSEVIEYFTFPREGTSYKATYGYVNGAIKNPNTAGPGVMALRFAGLAIILFATALLTYYVLSNKRRILQLIAAIK